jgi:hypothetical protein
MLNLSQKRENNWRFPTPSLSKISFINKYQFFNNVFCKLSVQMNLNLVDTVIILQELVTVLQNTIITELFNSEVCEHS